MLADISFPRFYLYNCIYENTRENRTEAVEACGKRIILLSPNLNLPVQNVTLRQLLFCLREQQFA